jgi:hypothetical protein
VEHANLAAIEDLNSILAEYRVTLSLEPSVSSDGERVGWRLGEEYERPDQADGRIDGFIVGELIWLARLGVLSLIRQCACGRWFYAERGAQRSHSPQCRKRKYEGKRDKKQRAEYMRWYYAMYQSPKAPRTPITFEQWKRRQQRRTDMANNSNGI